MDIETCVFETEDLLSNEDICLLLSSDYIDKKAKTISNKLKKYVMICNEIIYFFNNKYIYYINKGNIKDIEILRNILIEYICESLRHFEKTTTDTYLLYDHHNKKKLMRLQNISKDTFSLIISYLKKDDIFDKDNIHSHKIHFLNGYFDFKENQFKKREYGKDFVTYCIPREYDESKITEYHTHQINDILNKIYPEKEDRNKIYEYIGKALTGEITKDQICLFFLGQGSNGKSFIMNLLSLCLCDYVIQLRGDVFRSDNPKQDKILNSLVSRSFVKLIWVNEMEDKRVNETVLKEFVEGKIKTTMLYKDGLNEIMYNALCVLTSNNFPNIKIDGGIKRRIKAYTNKSLFVEELREINIAKNIYLKDKNIIDIVANSDVLKNAIFKIFSEYAVKSLKPRYKPFPETDNFKNTYASIISVNDRTGSFFETFLIKTDDEKKDRLRAIEIKDKYKELFGTNISEKEILNDMKNNGFQYEAKSRKNGIQGCFVRVRFNDKAIEKYKEDTDGNDTDEVVKIEDERNAEITCLKKQIEELKKQIEELKKPFAEEQESAIKLVVEEEPVEEEYVLEKPVVKPSKKRVVKKAKQEPVEEEYVLEKPVVNPSKKRVVKKAKQEPVEEQEIKEDLIDTSKLSEEGKKICLELEDKTDLDENKDADFDDFCNII